MADIPRPLRPWIIAAAGHWRFRKKLEVHDRLRTMAHSRANAIVTGVTATNDDDVLTLCINVSVVLQLMVQKRFGIQLRGNEMDNRDK
jgi:hypothetical protein